MYTAWVIKPFDQTMVRRKGKTIPVAIASATFNLSDGNWTDTEAKFDHHWMYRIDAGPSSVIILRAQFPDSDWDHYVELPLHYLEHCRLINYAYAWSRDILILGGWSRLNDLPSGSQMKIQAMKQLRELGKLQETYLRESILYTVDSFDDGRLPTLETYLFTLFYGRLHDRDEAVELVGEHGWGDVLKLGSFSIKIPDDNLILHRLDSMEKTHAR
jgi:hypothetical protein